MEASGNLHVANARANSVASQTLGRHDIPLIRIPIVVQHIRFESVQRGIDGDVFQVIGLMAAGLLRLEYGAAWPRRLADGRRDRE